MSKRTLTERKEEAKRKLDIASAKLSAAQYNFNKAKAAYESLEIGASIRDRIRDLKERHGITFEDIAVEMGTTKQYAESYINKGRISPKRLHQIATALGTTIEYLCTGKVD